MIEEYFNQWDVHSIKAGDKPPPLFYNEFHTIIDEGKCDKINYLNHLFTIKDNHLVKIGGVGLKHIFKTTVDGVYNRENTVQTPAKRIITLPLIHYQLIIKNRDILSKKVITYGL